MAEQMAEIFSQVQGKGTKVCVRETEGFGEMGPFFLALYICSTFYLD